MNLITSVSSMVLTLSIYFSMSFGAHAAPPVLNDFAYTATLSNAKTSLRQFDLPIDVYSKMYRRDYGDLRVFSANGQVVPHQFSRAESSISTQTADLSFYPFSRKQANTAGNIDIEINQNTGKQQLKIKQSLVPQNKNTTEYQYIIENKRGDNEDKNNKNHTSLCQLSLNWKQDSPSLILGLQLQASDNLQQWKSLSRTLNVSRLNYADSTLERNDIAFTCTSLPYLRLTWLTTDNKLAEANVRLQRIKGFYTQKGAQQTQWQSLTKPQYNDEGHWLFESNVIAPLVKMEFVAPQNGLLYKGRLFSRNHKDQQWRYRNQITQYRLHLGDSELQSNAFSLSGINDRYWKLEPTLETQFTETQLPEIKAAWASNKVLFIAQGEEPFQLAFGNPDVIPTKNNDLKNLIDSLQKSGSTVDTVSLTHIVDNEKYHSQSNKTNWKKIALWLVLLLGTLLMAFMAYRLYQQIKHEKY